MSEREKVVIVSLHKTGTTSVANFLEDLGYLVTGPDTNLYYDVMQGKYENVDSFLSKYDAFQDDPWYKIYPYTSERYPNAKFIFLEREETSWLESVQKFYGSDRFNNKVRHDFYGATNTIANGKMYIDKYRSHREDVFRFFESADNFISIDVRKDADAIRLQDFLGLSVKFSHFPHANKTPMTKAEVDAAKKKRYIRSYFGLNKVVKKVLKAVFGYERYIAMRSAIRLRRAKFRVLKKRIFK